MHKRRSWVAVALLLALLLAVGGPVSAQVSAQVPDVIRLGLTPWEDAQEMIQNFRPLVEYLEKELGVRIQPFVALDYGGVVEALRAGHLEVAMLTPFVTVLGRLEADAYPIATIVPPSQSIIVTYEGSGVETLDDLQGKTFAFVDPASATGYLLPAAMLKRMGYDPDTFFGRVVYAGGQDAVALAIQNKTIQGGAMATIVYNRMVNDGIIDPDVVKIIARSELIPRSSFVVAGRMPHSFAMRLQEVLIKIDDPEILAPLNTTEIIKTDFDEYRPFLDVAEYLGVDLRTLE